MKHRSTTFRTLLMHSIRSDFATRERLVTPLFFGAIVLLLFSFAIPESAPELRNRMLVAESLLSVFFALQITLSRAFEPERTDRIFDMMRTHPVSPTAFMLAKMCYILIVSAMTLMATGVLSLLLQGQPFTLLGEPTVWAFSFLALIGLTALGVLLSAITLRAHAQQVLFPLLYFPLSVPVLLGSCEGLVAWMTKFTWTESTRSWFIVLAAFDVIYVTLALLLGADSIASD